MDLGSLGLVDHHAHGILHSVPGTLDEFRGLFSESPDPSQWPHHGTGVAYRAGIRALAELFDVEPSEEGVFAYRHATDPDEYARRLLHATGTKLLLVDDGFPLPPAGTTVEELGKLAGCGTRPVLRIERIAAQAGLEAVREEVASARGRGYAALKTIAAYRGGLDFRALGERSDTEAIVLAALEANEVGGDPLPVQVHTGFGDSDLHLQRADPAYLKPLLERFPATPFVLLHCYPFVREAGWLASVYANAFFDLSLTIPHVARPAEALREALELAPVSKLLYGSDAARTPELFYLAAAGWRQALAQVLPELLPTAEATEAAHLILAGNARRLYRL
jgi:hypothetical protein